MIEIEFENPNIEICECCGKETLKLAKFVYTDDTAPINIKTT